MLKSYNAVVAVLFTDPINLNTKNDELVMFEQIWKILQLFGSFLNDNCIATEPFLKKLYYWRLMRKFLFAYGTIV